MKCSVFLLFLAAAVVGGGCSSSEEHAGLQEDDIQNAFAIPNDGNNPAVGVNPDAGDNAGVLRTSNQTIVYPDNDLYQVQTASDFRALCEGGAFCSVEPGEYLVINLSTGERYGPLTVNGSASSTPDGGLAAVEYIVASINPPSACRGESAPTVGLSWPRVASATGGAVEYTVSLNGNAFIVTGDQSVSFAIDAISVDVALDAPSYRFSVSASSVNEFASAAREVDVFNSKDVLGDSQPSVGRPGEDRTTHGFAFWDNMSLVQQCRWPSDCLFATGHTGDANSLPTICFSPNQRELINPPNFRFSLPGDNASNNVEAIEWAGGNGMLIIADITQRFGQSAYELSYFEQAGTFSGTFPILQSVAALSSDSPRGINLDGKDIREVRGLQDSAQCPQATSIYVIGEYYEKRSQSSADTLAGWMNMGAFAAKIDARSGQERALKYFPGRTQESLLFSVLPDPNSC